MGTYKNSINDLKFHGIPYRTFINADGDMIIRYNEYGEDYTDEVYAADGSLICVVDVTDGYVHIQGGDN